MKKNKKRGIETTISRNKKDALVFREKSQCLQYIFTVSYLWQYMYIYISVQQNLEVTDLIGSTRFNATRTYEWWKGLGGKHPRCNSFHLGYTARRSVNTQSATFRLIWPSTVYRNFASLWLVNPWNFPADSWIRTHTYTVNKNTHD